VSASAARSRTLKATFDLMGGIAPGLILSGALALVAARLAPLTTEGSLAAFGRPITITPPVLALLIGMALHPVGARPSFSPGTTFAIKKVLRWAIAAFGVKISVADVLHLGIGNAAMVVASMALTMASAIMLARLLGLGDVFGIIAGAATAICGASAAMAIATVLPEYSGRQKETAFVVIAVNGFATIAMTLYPPLCAALGFDDQATGVFLGSSIHDVAQVVGTGYSVSEIAGNTATVVKLFRVFLLLPIVVGTSWWFAKSSGRGENDKLPVPVFALMFLAVVVLNSTGEMSNPMRAATAELSRAGLLVAMAALGLSTSLFSIVRMGRGQLFTVFGATLVAFLVPLAWLVATN
jgi:uncharacterized integral membrane protein (TIGR00698 family)